MSLNDELNDYLHAHDVNFVGATTVAPIQLVNGARADPRDIMPEARSLVVTGFYTCTGETPRPCEPGIPRGRFGPWTRLARPAIQHQIKVVTAFFKERGFQLKAVDVPAKPAAVRARLASYGKNSIVHVAGFGSYVKLQPFLTDAVLDAVEMPLETSDCGDCTACIDACPTGALATAYRLNESRCICAWLWGKPIPRDMRKHAGNHLFRCSYCQDACPLNGRLTPRPSIPFELDGPSGSPELIPLMLGDDALLQRSLPQFVMSAGRDNIRRNIALALGNIADPAGVPALAAALNHPAAKVRAYSAWALGEIGGAEASDALKRAAIMENDPDVRDEIEAALSAAT